MDSGYEAVTKNSTVDMEIVNGSISYLLSEYICNYQKASQVKAISANVSSKKPGLCEIAVNQA